MKYNKAYQEAIDRYFQDPTFQAMVEKDIGAPVRVQVDWDKGEILVQGPDEGRVLSLDEVLRLALRDLPSTGGLQ